MNRTAPCKEGSGPNVNSVEAQGTHRHTVRLKADLSADKTLKGNTVKQTGAKNLGTVMVLNEGQVL